MKASNPSSSHLQIHGHRGCRGLFPENTLPAFLHALALGVDVLELDVVISADHQVVVAHEPWLSSVLGLSPTGKPIASADEHSFNIYQLPYTTIQQSIVGTIRHPLFPQQQQVPTYRPLLREVFAAVEAACQRLGRPPVGYSIEVKCAGASDGIFHPTPAIFISLVLDELPSALLPRITLLSFDERVLQEARKKLPHLALCYLVEEPFAVEQLFKKVGFVPQVFGPDFQLLTQSVLKQINTLYPDLSIIPWTVNEPVDITRIKAWGVDGITTDYPDRALALRNTL